MTSLSRITAIAAKEWRLNLRFPLEYLASNLVSPIKSAILMYFIYAGLLKGGQYSLGLLNEGNFRLYVLIGTTCHSLLMASVYVFRSKMVNEKWWQTVTATLISPASSIELILGFIIGSGTINLFISGVIFVALTALFNIPIDIFLVSLLVLGMLALFGFGIGLIGATLALCWEGKSFIFDYAIQALIFLSCFYYPIETLPVAIHPLIRLLPTYHANQLIQQLFITGNASHTLMTFLYLGGSCIVALSLPSVFFGHSVKKYGITGY